MFLLLCNYKPCFSGIRWPRFLLFFFCLESWKLVINLDLLIPAFYFYFFNYEHNRNTQSGWEELTQELFALDVIQHRDADDRSRALTSAPTTRPTPHIPLSSSPHSLLPYVSQTSKWAPQILFYVCDDLFFWTKVKFDFSVSKNLRC